MGFWDYIKETKDSAVVYMQQRSLRNAISSADEVAADSAIKDLLAKNVSIDIAAFELALEQAVDAEPDDAENDITNIRKYNILLLLLKIDEFATNKALIAKNINAAVAKDNAGFLSAIWPFMNRTPTALKALFIKCATKDAAQCLDFLYCRGVNIDGIIDNPSANPNALRKTPLMLAAENGSANAVELLLQRGADLYIKTRAANGQLYAAIDFAKANNHPACTKLLWQEEVYKNYKPQIHNAVWLRMLVQGTVYDLKQDLDNGNYTNQMLDLALKVATEAQQPKEFIGIIKAYMYEHKTELDKIVPEHVKKLYNPDIENVHITELYGPVPIKIESSPEVGIMQRILNILLAPFRYFVTAAKSTYNYLLGTPEKEKIIEEPPKKTPKRKFAAAPETLTPTITIPPAAREAIDNLSPDLSTSLNALFLTTSWMLSTKLQEAMINHDLELAFKLRSEINNLQLDIQYIIDSAANMQPEAFIFLIEEYLNKSVRVAEEGPELGNWPNNALTTLYKSADSQGRDIREVVKDSIAQARQNLGGSRLEH